MVPPSALAISAILEAAATRGTSGRALAAVEAARVALGLAGARRGSAVVGRSGQEGSGGNSGRVGKLGLGGRIWMTGEPTSRRRRGLRRSCKVGAGEDDRHEENGNLGGHM
ncbi:hypothetical protein HPP92_010768 [Vanilla planifolia]|uniref:Uncharacterized protein n=1 Tax=Vanilla planifolia TaxID=51239 RepID=A0A835R5S5_VANPL|nr:hypothetical protein HPP92_010768 [Vanilla planifolia]